GEAAEENQGFDSIGMLRRVPNDQRSVNVERQHGEPCTTRRVRYRGQLFIGLVFGRPTQRIDVAIGRPPPALIHPQGSTEGTQPATVPNQGRLFPQQIERIRRPARNQQIDRTFTAYLIRDPSTLAGLHIRSARHLRHTRHLAPNAQPSKHRMPALGSLCCPRAAQNNTSGSSSSCSWYLG